NMHLATLPQARSPYPLPRGEEVSSTACYCVSTTRVSGWVLVFCPKKSHDYSKRHARLIGVVCFGSGADRSRKDRATWSWLNSESGLSSIGKHQPPATADGTDLL